MTRLPGGRSDDRTPLRSPRMEVLRNSDAGRPRARRSLVGSALLRAVMPVLFAIAIGMLVGRTVQRGDNLTTPLILVGAVFVPLQMLSPMHQAIGAESWQSDRRVAQRQADIGVRRSPRGWATSRIRN